MSAVGTPSTLDPRGPDAEVVADLWWWMLGAGMGVFALVVVLLLVALRRSSRRERPVSAPWTRTAVLALGIGLPVVVLVPLSVGTFLTARAVDVAEGEPGVVVEVVGHQFWWEVRYPELGVVTANEVHVPVGVPVQFRLSSQDVNHSFWVPQLAGKLDMIPGRDNSYRFTAGKPGVYEGICAEFCGIQHARMHFILVAEPQADFELWAAQQAEPETSDLSPLGEQGRDVFLASSCSACHRVEGASDGQIGPDLTHLASRRTLAAGLLENNRGNLAGWILAPQDIKPGVRMPGSSLTGPELQALLAYLEELE